MVDDTGAVEKNQENITARNLVVRSTPFDKPSVAYNEATIRRSYHSSS